jgi:hypothetical protein
MSQDAGGEGKRQRLAADSSENRVNAIPATISAWVWPRRKRERKGKRLGAYNEGPGAVDGGRRQGAAPRRRRASVTVGRGEGRGKQAGEDPYPKVELRRRLAAAEERRGGDDDSGRGAAAKVVAQARVCKARGGGFIGWPRGPRRAGPGCRASGGGARASVGLGFEPESGSREETSRQVGSACQRERRERREAHGWAVGPGRRAQAGWATLGDKKKKRKDRLGWALWEEKERGEKERGSGPGPKRKRRRKRNAFEFKFK